VLKEHAGDGRRRATQRVGFIPQLGTFHAASAFLRDNLQSIYTCHNEDFPTRLALAATAPSRSQNTPSALYKYASTQAKAAVMISSLICGMFLHIFPSTFIVCKEIIRSDAARKRPFEMKGKVPHITEQQKEKFQ
jgi:hypothetical protein